MSHVLFLDVVKMEIYLLARPSPHTGWKYSGLTQNKCGSLLTKYSQLTLRLSALVAVTAMVTVTVMSRVWMFEHECVESLASG